MPQAEIKKKLKSKPKVCNLKGTDRFLVEHAVTAFIDIHLPDKDL